MATTVIVNDYEACRRSVVILDTSDFEFVARMWSTPDRILAELQAHPLYAGRTRWCDLDPPHFRYMIVLTMVRVAKLEEDARNDAANPVVRSLHFLMTALIACLQARSETNIELIRFNRVSQTEIVYDFSASLNLAADPQKPASGLKMVIDNT